ncbi:MAG: 3-dehydroquinate synthase [Bacteroidota bacterium]
MHYTIKFPAGQTEYFLNANYSQLLQVAPVNNAIIITDENIHRHYGHLFTQYRVLIIDAGESSKSWETIQQLAEKLIHFDVHKTSVLVGVGGGVVCDITGFLATIYMRGIAFAFAPTTLLAMVDASIGGKNGVNVGLNKNILGTIKQPRFILFDNSFLETLSDEEWSSGFAEVIKYACIGDAVLFEQLSQSSIVNFQNNPAELNRLIASCVMQKNRIVLEDEQEKNIRKTLNFGHTAGHAFETLCYLKHGHAVALGMILSLIASEMVLDFPKDIRPKFTALLLRYNLPVQLKFEVEKVLKIILHDKKRNNEFIDFVLLKDIGQSVVHPLSFEAIRSALQIFLDEYQP